MKKGFLFALLLCVTLSAFAAKPLKVISGKSSSLQDFATATVVFDYSETTWEGDESLQEYCGDDFEPRINRGYKEFVKEFNANSKNLKVVEGDDSEVIIRIVFKEFEQKQGASAWGRFFLRFYGTIEFVKRGTSEVVCSLEMDKLGGDADYSQDDRFAKAYAALAKELATLK